jgi:peptidase YpeB-like protein
MIKAVGLALVLALGSTLAFAADDDDDKVPDAEVAKVKAAIAEFGCTDFEGIKKEELGLYEIDDAKCKMGTMDIKLDKDLSVILISRY